MLLRLQEEASMDAGVHAKLAGRHSHDGVSGAEGVLETPWGHGAVQATAIQSAWRGGRSR